MALLSSGGDELTMVSKVSCVGVEHSCSASSAVGLAGEGAARQRRRRAAAAREDMEDMGEDGRADTSVAADEYVDEISDMDRGRRASEASLSWSVRIRDSQDTRQSEYKTVRIKDSQDARQSGYKTVRTHDSQDTRRSGPN